MSTAGNKRDIVQEALRERRRFRRVRISQGGRAFIASTAEEVACTISDVSVGGARISCRLDKPPNGKAVIYLAALGQFEGPITSITEDGFTMAFMCSRQKRDRLADLLTVEVNRHVLAAVDR